MPLVMPPALPPTFHSREATTEFWGTRDAVWSRDLLYCDPMRQFVESFTIGDVYYRVLRQLPALYEPPMGGRQGRFIAAPLSPDFVGNGDTLEAAREDWQLQIDFAIQRFLAMQDFEFTSDQRRQRRVLSRYFDLNEIRYSQPLKVRAYGELVSQYPRPIRVRWVDGTKNTLTRQQISSEMVGFVVGQPFEAVVERNPRTWELIRIQAAFRTTGLPSVSADEAAELLQNVSSTRNLPPLSWD